MQRGKPNLIQSRTFKFIRFSCMTECEESVVSKFLFLSLFQLFIHPKPLRMAVNPHTPLTYIPHKCDPPGSGHIDRKRRR